MFKREDAGRPSQAQASGSVGQVGASLPTSVVPRREVGVGLGRSVVLRGDLTGNEDLTIDGQVEGKIELRQHCLTIGPNGRIRAQVFAKAVVVQGEVVGNITATERIELREESSVTGDLVTPRIAIVDGAHFRGSIDMQRQGTRAGGELRPVEGLRIAAAPIGLGPTR